MLRPEDANRSPHEPSSEKSLAPITLKRRRHVAAEQALPNVTDTFEVATKIENDMGTELHQFLVDESNGDFLWLLQDHKVVAVMWVANHAHR